MNVSDEAIEAAAREVESALQSGEGVRDIARVAIEAALPHMNERRTSEARRPGQVVSDSAVEAGLRWLITSAFRTDPK